MPATLVDILKEDIGQEFEKEIDNDLSWEIEVKIDPMTGAAENVKEILDEAYKLKQNHHWDYAVCVTDLPIFDVKSTVLADANITRSVAQISLPAFGWRPTPRRLKKMIVQMVREMHLRRSYEDNRLTIRQKGVGSLSIKKDYQPYSKLKETFRFSNVRRCESPVDQEDTTARFIIFPKVNGLARILFGMTVANRPWAILPSFKGVVALAFATGAYGLIFPTLWRLSVIYQMPRFIGLMATAVVGMVTWIIFAHDLWEKKEKRKEKKKEKKLRWLYNSATVMTLGTSVMLYYLVLYILFLVAVTVFVPPDLYDQEANKNVGPVNYAALAWLVTSVATFAGAIGAGLEKPERVRKSAYSYRQYVRYEQMKEKEKKEEEEKYGKENE